MDPPDARYEQWRRWLPAVLASAVLLAMALSVDIYPIITNDSLEYIEHSNSLGELGFVQLGYRQVGYPAFLASTDTIATVLGVDPLFAAAFVQRLVFLGALGFIAWIWRWPALPLVLFGMLPSLAAYTNLILTEGLAVGLALWYAALVAWTVQRLSDPTDDSETLVSHRWFVAAGASAGVIFALLVAIRFQYILMNLGLLAVLYVLHRSGKKLRTASFLIGASIVIFVSLFLLATSRENSEEYGVFFPSVRGEKSQFWAVWHTTFELHPENATNPELLDLFDGGTPYAVMRDIERLPTYALQQARYAEAIEHMIDVSDLTWWKARKAAFFGVLSGGRFDDVEGVVFAASRSDSENVEESMYRAYVFDVRGAKYFVDTYNNGRELEALFISKISPVRGMPYFVWLIGGMLLSAMAVLAVGVLAKPSRLLSLVGLMTLGVSGVVFGYFLMDNVRFVLVPSLFVLGIATGVGDMIWRRSRSSA